MARLQHLHDEVTCQEAVCATHKHEGACQEAACAAQCLIDKRAALERQAAKHCQHIQDEMAAEQKIAAIVAAQVIFLWLHC